MKLNTLIFNFNIFLNLYLKSKNIYIILYIYQYFTIIENFMIYNYIITIK